MQILEMHQETLQEILQDILEINLQTDSLQTTQTKICQNLPLESQLKKKKSKTEWPEQLLQGISQIDLKRLSQLHLHPNAAQPL